MKLSIRFLREAKPCQGRPDKSLGNGQLSTELAQSGATSLEIKASQKDQVRSLPGSPTVSWAGEVISHLRHPACVYCVTSVGAEEPLNLHLPEPPPHTLYLATPWLNRKLQVSGPTEPQLKS